MVLYDYEDKNGDVINEEEFDWEVVWRSIRESRPVKILEPQWDIEKSYLQLRKVNRVTFEDDMPNTKTEMNHTLLTQKIERSKRMEYSE